MTDPIKTPEQAAKEKKERRDKEVEALKKQVDDMAAKHDELGKKFLKEDAEEAEKKLKKE